MAKETNIDCRKYRKSTHLAAADLDAMSIECKSLIFTIKEAWYETKVDVSGSKTDGYFCSFVEPIKDMVINSTNRKTIAGFAKQNGFNEVDCWNIGNWSGIKIELYPLRDIQAFGKIQDGIRIKPIQPSTTPKPKPVFTEANFEKAHANKATIEMIKNVYDISTDMEILYTDYVNANS
jgi:hypothetical protein